MAPPRLYKTEAIVLRQRRLGEADRIVILYTPAYGKLEAKAKGVRKPTSRMAGHLQPLTRCMVQLAQGRASDVVAGCQTIESFQALREDLDRLSRALYAVELVDRLTPERVPGFATYRLLQRASYNEIVRLKMPLPLAQEVERHLRSHIVYVLERDVNAAAFIDRLR